MPNDELSGLRKLLPHAGFELARTNGGHEVWKKGTRVLVLPAHGRFTTGQLARRIVAQARKAGVKI